MRFVEAKRAPACHHGSTAEQPARSPDAPAIDCHPLKQTLEARGLGPVSINVRITAVRKLAVEAADNGLLAPELANGITRVKGVASKGVRLGNWLTAWQAQTLLNAPDITTNRGLWDAAKAIESEDIETRVSELERAAGTQRK